MCETAGQVDRRRFLLLTAGSLCAAAVGCRSNDDGTVTGLSERPSTAISVDSNPSTALPAPTSLVAPVTTPSTTAPRPAATRQLLCRAAWGAGPQKGERPAHVIDKITVHHTAEVLRDNRRAPEILRGIQSFHQGRGFVDFAYHIAIDGNGHAYEARSQSIAGETFTEYDPTGHLLVVLLGNFEEQDVPDAQLASLADVLAWGSTTYRVDPETIAGHRDFAATACPGTRLYEHLSDRSLHAMVGDRLASGGIELVTICGPEANDLIAGVESGAV